MRVVAHKKTAPLVIHRLDALYYEALTLEWVPRDNKVSEARRRRSIGAEVDQNVVPGVERWAHRVSADDHMLKPRFCNWEMVALILLLVCEIFSIMAGWARLFLPSALATLD